MFLVFSVWGFSVNVSDSVRVSSFAAGLGDDPVQVLASSSPAYRSVRCCMSVGDVLGR